MKNIKAKTGPLKQRPVYELLEIENICVSELKKYDLLPDTPSPIRIERFIEKCFGVTPTYEDIGTQILGYTEFGPNGVKAIFVSSILDEKRSISSARRARSTLAHEAGHGLLHSHLFIGGKPSPLIQNEGRAEPKILCRETHQSYDGRWWEFQANKAMASLLLPMHLVEQAVRPLFGTGILVEVPKVLEATKFEEAKKLISEVFDVNPIVAELRLRDREALTTG